jgi:hypothetical protein
MKEFKFLVKEKKGSERVVKVRAHHSIEAWKSLINGFSLTMLVEVKDLKLL